MVIAGSNLSSSSLFHFTKTEENLLGILDKGFLPNYVTERFGATGIGFHSFPMICFCDIPLALSRKHVRQYGNYALGLTKEWGIQNNVTPVAYYHPSSNLLNAAYAVIDAIRKRSTDPKVVEDIDMMVEVMTGISDLLFFLKPYESIDNGTKTRFYDEKEWRFIPPNSSFKPFMSSNSVTNLEEIANWSAKVKEVCQLHFEPQDVRYIIVEKENEIPQAVDRISSIVTKRRSADEGKLLVTKIISMDRIYEDF